MNHPLVFIGGGGHASVLVELAKILQKPIFGFVAPTESKIPGFPEIPYLGDGQALRFSEEVRLINSVGSISVEKNRHREQLFTFYKAKGFTFETLIHPLAIVASNVELK